MRPKFFQVVTCLAICAASSNATAQERQDVTFEINQTTQFGTSVFVLGDLPELGGNDLRFAVKLEPSSYPIWKATISLPVNRSYTYRYYLRNDAAGQWGNAANGTPIGNVLSSSTISAPLDPSSKTVFYHSGFEQPVLWWRQPSGSGAFQSITMHEVGPGRNPGEKRWAARRFGTPRQSIDFYLTNIEGTLRDPVGSSTYTTPLDSTFVQDANLFTYVPASGVGGPIKRYTTNGAVPSTPSTFIISPAMGETRRYRVITPRGYDQHPQRRYPVLYMHDGQNMFEQGSFGTWNADETAESMIRGGRMREVILVGADHGPNRLSDYAAPDSGGWANGRYLTFMRDELKPIIDGQYRTLSGPEDTGVLGSSMGGQASMWFGWDAPGSYTKLGVFSGAWTVFNTGFYNRVQSQPKRSALRIYLDSGDSGTSADQFWNTVGLRDNLINPARAGGAAGPYVLERDLRHVYGPGQVHNEGAWASRLPQCYAFLYPATEAPNELAGVPSARPADVNDDDTTDIEDLYAWEQGMAGAGSTLDVDRDGAVESGEDRTVLITALRVNENTDSVVR